jgi:PKD repeat protein
VQTVAIVDAYDDPTAEADLDVYDKQFGLPACTSANGCFRKVNQTGGTSFFPPANSDWESEISLDLDAVSAICPNCHILLVEANSASLTDLQAAMQTANSMGANQISDSWWGTSQMPGRHTFSGVATVAATGDGGYVPSGAVYPAAYPGVTAAGGTSLASDPSSLRGFGELAWFGGGSGCNTGFSRPSYQPYVGCSGRVFADLSADADPDTGLKIYTPSGWAIYGGTSLATPVIAAYYAITGVSATTPQWAYTDSGLLNDVVAGSNGNCGIALCNARVGYDGPTGVGSISGTVATGAPGVAGPTYTSGIQNTYTQSVGSQGATIGGGIYRNGLDTTWWIEYGTSQTYGTTTSPVDVGAGTAPIAVTGSLTGLTPSTIYHYRLVAKNARGTTYGYDYTLTTATPSAPSAAFTASPSAPTPSSSVTFDAGGSTAGTSGTISDYGWNFGDGNSQDTGTTASASHSYTNRGNYTVTLTITNNRGQTSTSTQTVTVDNPPTAGVAPSTMWTAPAATVSFDASGSSPGAGGTIQDYSWDFGDGTVQDGGASDSATHAFTSPGVYTVKLTATDDLNVANSATAVITVDQPNASFAAAPAIVAPGGTISFDGTGSTDPEQDAITDYSWNFGDGNSQNNSQDGPAPTASHQYASRGNYDVTLTITNNHGQTSTTTQTVTADNPPTPAFTAAASSITAGSPVTFDGSASTAGRISDYTWSFGDGTIRDTGSSSSTTYTFTSAGPHTVTLTTTDDLGVSAAATQQIAVQAPIAATSTPPVPAPAPVTTPTTSPPASPPPSNSTASPSLVLRLSVAGRQRLAAVLAHGLRLGLAVNQRTRASYQISIPLSETRQTAGRAGDRKATVVLLRTTQNLATGNHTIVLKLSRAAARRLAARGSLVLTVRITLTDANGKTLTRTAKIRLTR